MQLLNSMYTYSKTLSVLVNLLKLILFPNINGILLKINQF